MKLVFSELQMKTILPKLIIKNYKIYKVSKFLLPSVCQEANVFATKGTKTKVSL